MLRSIPKQGRSTIVPISICAIEPSGQQYGSELALLDILVGLAKDRFNSYVILPKDGTFRVRLAESKIPFFEFLRIDLQSGRNVQRAFSYARIFLHWLTNRPDVILVNQGGILRGIALCNFLFRKPIVCLVTTIEDAVHMSKLPTWVFRHVRKIVCNSEYTSARVNIKVKAGSGQGISIVDRNQVVYCSYLPKNLYSVRPAWNPNNEHQKFFVGILGRICNSKGHDLLLNALACLKKQDSKWLKRIEVAFVGDYSQQEEQSMRKLIAGAPVSVQVTGFRKDIKPELARLHLLLIPSRAEPFGRVVQEAADAGIPVIASNTGGLAEICSRYHYGALFNYPSAEDLAGHIESAMQNYDQLVDESHANRVGFLATFEYKKIMAEVEELLVRSCESHR